MEVLGVFGILTMVFLAILTCTEKRLEKKLSNAEKKLNNVEKELRKAKKSEDFAISTMIEVEGKLLMDIEWHKSEVSFWKEEALAHGWTEDCFEPEQFEGREEAKHEREVMWQHGIIDEREVA